MAKKARRRGKDPRAADPNQVLTDGFLGLLDEEAGLLDLDEASPARAEHAIAAIMAGCYSDYWDDARVDAALVRLVDRLRSRDGAADRAWLAAIAQLAATRAARDGAASAGAELAARGVPAPRCLANFEPVEAVSCWQDADVFGEHAHLTMSFRRGAEAVEAHYLIVLTFDDGPMLGLAAELPSPDAGRHAPGEPGPLEVKGETQPERWLGVLADALRVPPSELEPSPCADDPVVVEELAPNALILRGLLRSCGLLDLEQAPAEPPVPDKAEWIEEVLASDAAASSSIDPETARVWLGRLHELSLAYDGVVDRLTPGKLEWVLTPPIAGEGDESFQGDVENAADAARLWVAKAVAESDWPAAATEALNDAIDQAVGAASFAEFGVDEATLAAMAHGLEGLSEEELVRRVTARMMAFTDMTIDEDALDPTDDDERLVLILLNWPVEAMALASAETPEERARCAEELARIDEICWRLWRGRPAKLLDRALSLDGGDMTGPEVVHQLAAELPELAILTERAARYANEGRRLMEGFLEAQ